MGDLLTEAFAISLKSPAIRGYAVDQAQQFLALKAKVDAQPQPPPPSPSGREPCVYHINTDLGCPTDGSDWSTVLQSYLTGSQMLPLGAAIKLAPLSYSPYRWCVEIGDRTDISWLGHHSGQVGNYSNSAKEMVGSWVRPARDAAPVFNCEAANTGQNGPVIEWIKSYHGDWNTGRSPDAYSGSLIRVKNVNNGVIEHVGSMYGKAPIETAMAGSTSDCAWWRCVDVRAFDCAYGIAYIDGNLGWTLDGGIVTRAQKGQRGIRLTGYSQNNKIIAYRCDGAWNATQITGGSGGLVDGGAHDNHIDIAKIESALPSFEFQSALGLEHPTARNVIGGGVIGLRYKQGPAFKIGPRVDWTKIEDDITYVNGPDDDTQLIAIDPLAMRTKRPPAADLIRG